MDTIAKVAAAVESHLKHENSGHDWQHIYRVWQTANKLAKEEGANAEVVSLAALLHDVDDYKVTGDATSEETLPNAHRIMEQCGVPDTLQGAVHATLKTMGFSKSMGGKAQRSLETHVLSDADMLDSIGAVGIARTFTYCGHKGHGMFDPAFLPRENLTQEQYRKQPTPSVTHFFEKLLKLRTMMHTASGKAEAQVRHQRMVTFLNDFFTEAAAPQVWKDLLKPYR